MELLGISLWDEPSRSNKGGVSSIWGWFHWDMSLDPLTCLVASAIAAQCLEQCQQLRGCQTLARSPRDREHELSIYKPRILSQTHLCHLWGQVLR